MIHRGVRGLGLLDPVTRSNTLRASRSLRKTSMATFRIRSNEEAIARDAERLGIFNARFEVGTAANRPQATYLATRGVKSLLYFATDTFVLSAWTGTVWKTTTLT